MAKKLNLTFSDDFQSKIFDVMYHVEIARLEKADCASLIPEKLESETYGQYIDRIAPIKKTVAYAGHEKLANDHKKEAEKSALAFVPAAVIDAIKGTFLDGVCSEGIANNTCANTVLWALKEWLEKAGVDCKDTTAMLKFDEAFLRFVNAGRKKKRSDKAIALECVLSLVNFACEVRRQWILDQGCVLVKKTAMKKEEGI